MRTNIVIDDILIKQAMKASGLRTKRATIEEALRLYIQIHGQTQIRKFRGKVRWEGNLEESRKGRIAEEPGNYRP